MVIKHFDKSLLFFVISSQMQDQHQLRIVCPGVVSSLTCTPDGLYCIAGIAEKIYVWQVRTEVEINFVNIVLFTRLNVKYLGHW